MKEAAAQAPAPPPFDPPTAAPFDPPAPAPTGVPIAPVPFDAPAPTGTPVAAFDPPAPAPSPYDAPAKPAFDAPPPAPTGAPTVIMGAVPPPPPGVAPTAPMPTVPPQGGVPQFPPPPTAQFPQPTTVQFPQPVPAQFPQPVAPAPAKPKKSKKGLFIGIGAGALVILIVVGVIIGINVTRSNNYDKAVTMLEAGSYQEAYDAFNKLGDYKDSIEQKELAWTWLKYVAAKELFNGKDYKAAQDAFKSLGGFEDSANYVKLCEQNIAYLQAIADYEAGSYDKALDAFYKLAGAGFSDASDWVDKTEYAIADKKFKDGDKYGAYNGFKALGSYKDSADRMKQCTTPFPGTGELYHNSGFVSSRSAIAIDAVNLTYVTYFKIYNGTTLVSTMWINPGEKCTIDVPPGTYTIKRATGSAWFGEEIMFGEEGNYVVMTFEGGNDSYSLDDNKIVTITMAVASGGNTGTKGVGSAGF